MSRAEKDAARADGSAVRQRFCCALELALRVGENDACSTLAGDWVREGSCRYPRVGDIHY